MTIKVTYHAIIQDTNNPTFKTILFEKRYHNQDNAGNKFVLHRIVGYLETQYCLN